MRECEDADPYIIARYCINIIFIIVEYGIEKKALTANLAEADIE